MLSDCESGPLGMANGGIPDSSITGSSYTETNGWNREPKYARLGGDRFWLNNKTDTLPWIQVDLSSTKRVTGLQTEGKRATKSHWVEQVKVQVGLTEENLRFIEDVKGQPKVCKINSLHAIPWIFPFMLKPNRPREFGNLTWIFLTN